jgi:hypothetical protein
VVLVRTSRELLVFFEDELSRCPSRPWSAGPSVFFGGRLVKAHEGRDREADPPASGDRSGEANRTPGEHRPVSDSGPPRVRISAGSKALELRGIVIFWFSEQENAMPETAGGQRRRKRTALRRGKALKGEPHEWHRSP